MLVEEDIDVPGSDPLYIAVVDDHGVNWRIVTDGVNQWWLMTFERDDRGEYRNAIRVPQLQPIYDWIRVLVIDGIRKFMEEI